jgi:hypothetical protein
MTTFDTSTAPRDGSGPGFPAASSAPDEPVATPFEPGAAEGPDSLLDQLRARVDERDEAEPDEWFKEVRGLGIRLVCDLNIEADAFQRWFKGAQARKGGRRKTMASASDLDQFALSVRALTATCIRLEIKRGDAWTPMTGAGGVALDLESRELLRTFNVMDAASVLRKLFGRDARVIDAGQELLDAAGYLGGDDDDDNPE